MVILTMPPPVVPTETWDTGDGNYVANPYNHENELSKSNPVRPMADTSAKAMIAQKDAGVTLVVLPNSKHFDMSQSIKLKLKQDKNQPPIPGSVQVPYGGHPGPFSTPYPPPYPFFMSPYAYPGTYPLSSHHHQPHAVAAHYPPPQHLFGTHNDHAHAIYPPIMAMAQQVSLHTKITPLPCLLMSFCVAYNISEANKGKLRLLEYEPGDKGVTALLQEDYIGAGFSVLGWQRFMEAHRKYIAGV
ncbi:hypothetical protein EST38_g11148 [Candolleomyces aberdarensis]|uniref:Uncharacterized protein n=1 Tax=Candolleomyces aberdarensis TaxID=2316362 RepID=A0A4Q2D8V8_9AGAR|nr:hypothetical protein EST38_g11148 [Candolleomyces aberdarensis]